MTPKRILIVDDEIGCTRLLKANLELTNLYQVCIENRPENALHVARQFKPDLVLLDIVMPRMSGTHLAEAFLADPELKAVRIVFLTAVPTSSPLRDANPIIGRLPCIPKPTCMEDILQFLEKNLSPVSAPDTSIPAGPAPSPGGNNE